MTELCELAYKYKSDKCPKLKHFYTQYYYELFKDRRNEIKKVLEIGVGWQGDMEHCGKDYVTGASLFMWRDFFPNAQIYGIDIQDECVFKDDRIETFKYEQNVYKHLWRTLKQTGRDLDIVIDDGSHKTSDQIFTAMMLLPRINKDVVYIIEDVAESRAVIEALGYLEGKKIEVIQKERKRSRDDKLVVIQKI